MKKILLLTLKIELDELSSEDRDHQAELVGCETDELEGVKDVEETHIAELICETLMELPELTDGSMMHCLISDAQVILCAVETETLPQ